MAFLDNPAIILAHIRQSHVTSDDTGMCEMVLIDQDVDLEKCQLTLVPGSSCGSFGSASLSEGSGSMVDSHTCELSQSMDITSSWDFGIRRRSNTAQRLERLRKERQNQIKCKNVQWKERTTSHSAEDLGSLFEKRDYKDRPRTKGAKSTLSLRLEQCPQQLNNPFNEYSKFDGKVTGIKVVGYLSKQNQPNIFSNPVLLTLEPLKKKIQVFETFCPMYRLEKQMEPNVAVDLESTLESQNTLEFCLVRENSSRGEESSEEDPTIDITTVQDMLSSHHYKSFKISLIHRLRFTTDVQLGISGEKVEIDPVTNPKFWIRQKPISIDSDHLCACDLVEERSPSECSHETSVSTVLRISLPYVSQRKLSSSIRKAKKFSVSISIEIFCIHIRSISLGSCDRLHHLVGVGDCGVCPVGQGWATGGPGAAHGPRHHSVRPANRSIII
uniref:Target of rapamycin complex 2 subunit MAPKAP1 n=1 Tax=Fundulus heteroclitus TaxID=8078 RepID=A0A3Q2UKL9_FUNHE